jgi:hypothetical protein
MRVVGVDTHKATLAACVLDELGAVVGEATFPNDPVGFEALRAWLAEHRVERVGLEGSDWLWRGGRSLSDRRRHGRGRGAAAAQPPRAEPDPAGRQERSG